MVLNQQIRKEMDDAIKNWCPNVTLLKKEESRAQKVWKFKSGSDFIYGYLVGQMEGYIAGLIVGKHGKIPDAEESKEIRKMVEIRAKEIRQVMSKHEKKGKDDCIFTT
ncbi:MAG: hypothetical protein KGI28_03365 [Thaumarchaeota archaeon]|nr:hypothetical protein [Nitrososphaerota archaeon]